MRKIKLTQVSIFMFMYVTIFGLGIGVGWVAYRILPAGEFRAIFSLIFSIVGFYLAAFVIYRIFLAVLPLREGVIEEGSREETAAQVNILFYLLIFNSLIRTHFIPVPLMRLVYLTLGAKLGPNTYSAGVILDPPLTRLGAHCIIGHDAVIYAHAIEGQHFALEPVLIGDRVTIGATAIVMSGVVIGDGAIVSAKAVVTKGTVIGAGEVWGGIPARRLRGGDAIAAPAADSPTRRLPAASSRES